MAQAEAKIQTNASDLMDFLRKMARCQDSGGGVSCAGSVETFQKKMGKRSAMIPMTKNTRLQGRNWRQTVTRIGVVKMERLAAES